MTSDTPAPKQGDPDCVAIPLDPVDALRALLAVDPDAPPVDAKGKPQPDAAKRDDNRG